MSIGMARSVGVTVGRSSRHMVARNSKVLVDMAAINNPSTVVDRNSLGMVAVKSPRVMVVAKSHLDTVNKDPAITADKNAPNTRAVVKSMVVATATSDMVTSVPNNRTARRVSPVALVKSLRATGSLGDVVPTMKMNMVVEAGSSMAPVVAVMARRGTDVGIRVPC